MHEKLYQFMINRRKLHKMFDLIKCDFWFNSLEKNGYASEKNLILKDFYISFQQLIEFSEGKIQKKMISIEALLLGHL